MRKLLLLTPAIAFAGLCAAQQQQNKQEAKPVRVETEHEHKGASHTRTHTVAPAEHHSTVRWRYHSGAHRADAPATGSTQNTTTPAAPTQQATAPAKKD